MLLDGILNTTTTKGHKMSKQRAYALADKLGARIEDDGWAYQLEAPAGMVLSGSQQHTSCFSYEDGIKDPWSGRTVWQDILSELSHGVEVGCVDTSCDRYKNCPAT
jgi:hypothetical protein